MVWNTDMARAKNPRFKDLTGQIFGRLCVLEKTDLRKDQKIVWKCQCDDPCGNIVYVNSASLLSGNTKSCGCVRQEKLIARNTKHGDNKRGADRAPLYQIHADMVKRVTNPNSKYYHNYGGRGIAIHKPWYKYENFRDYMLALPNCPLDIQVAGAKITLTIDRYPDNNGHYEPGNVRWATRKQQMNNTRVNRMIIVRKHKQQLRMTLMEAVDQYGKVPYSVVQNRLLRNWPLTKAIRTPSLRKKA